MVCYLLGRPDELAAATADSWTSATHSGQPYAGYVHGCVAQAHAFMRGDFQGAERWAEEIPHQVDTFGNDGTDGPYGVQMFMIRRETGALERFRPYLDGRETFTGRWVPGLLALYTELGITPGMTRALHHLMDRDLGVHRDEAQWPMELVFMIEGALAVGDTESVRTLRPFVAEYAGMNIFCGTLLATFGSADRYLGRIAAFLGESATAEHHFVTAAAMDRHMRSTVHTAETLAHHARFLAAVGESSRARLMAQDARALAAPIGHRRVIHVLDSLDSPDYAARPDGLTEREVDVLRLIAAGLSNQQIGSQLHISSNTAAHHVRSILMKTGAANRTRAAMYAADHHLV